ncbi:GNAT family N-acetyltransferase [Kineosporia succinea]|uniref:N-acetyltransferase domain-containing protein n=1 Tax=Kineosporia succinea TaxID=84632 RepID=A0ABT9P608_9ACTN|nr:GNAT family N-acetyltransferase [Kineosporia succinea]MDP9828117.1 hypothetical protein [Kineosporia succinea]
MSDTGTALHCANTRARWTALDLPAGDLPNDDAVFSRVTSSGGEINVSEPVTAGRIEELLDVPVVGARNAVWDPYGVGGVRVPDGVRVVPLPVMVRPPGPLPLTGDVVVTAVGTQAELDLAEEVIVNGFPRPELQPWTPGCLLPAHTLHRPGWRTWLARRDGVPGAAGVSFDDGASVGAYWLASLPAMRAGGLASAVMTALVNARPGLPSVLVATPAGQALYERLGYRTVSSGCWYMRGR